MVVVYIDTNILLDLSGYHKIDKDSRQVLNKELYQKEIRIPQIVIGEALTVILEETNDPDKVQDHLENLKKTLLDLKCTSCTFPTADNKTIKCAVELEEISDVVDNMDSLILAHPMMDDDATHFYTKDKSLKNPKVHDYMKKLIEQNIRTQKLNIPEEFTED